MISVSVPLPVGAARTTNVFTFRGMVIRARIVARIATSARTARMNLNGGLNICLIVLCFLYCPAGFSWEVKNDIPPLL